jgi:hypothetical protein
MMTITVDFYKKLFAKELEANVKLGPQFWDDKDCVIVQENSNLLAAFSEKGIKEAIFSCYAEGAPRPDSLPFFFYQKFWDLVKSDLVELFDDFHKGTLDLYRLNYALVTLVPKVGEDTNMK